MELSCLIVDDEPRAHVVLDNYIARLSHIVSLGSCYNAIEAYDFMRATPVDVLFLDINMPEIDGFSLLEMINPKPIVIITTAYTNYALKSYDYNAIDYLQKPIRFERFVSAVDKAMKWKQINKVRDTGGFIEVKTNKKKEKIRMSDIVYVESLGNYVKIITADKQYITLMTTRDIEETLSKTTFVRIHKSYIININSVSSVNKDTAVLGDIVLPIGKTYKKYAYEIFKDRIE